MTHTGRNIKPKAFPSPNPSAFTLIELLVVISIISLLVAIMMPALSRARDQAKAVQCLSNLRQFALAAFMYADGNHDYFPPAYATVPIIQNISRTASWDFDTIVDWSAGGRKTWTPGTLWQGDRIPEEIHQCPTFRRLPDQDRPFTGYNYNTSYIGRGPDGRPAKTLQIDNPHETALFGDGAYTEAGQILPNNYMRAPLYRPDEADGFAFAYAGTQHYRHLQAANVAWCDGSARPWRSISDGHDNPDNVGKVDPETATGFLSPDNSAYDLK